MLVHVKEPLTEVRLSGPGADQVVADLKALYKERLVIDEDEEYVDVDELEWFKEEAAALTPGKRLRIYRENRSLNLAVLAELSGISKSNLSSMEHDKRPIGKHTAVRLAKALDCDYRSLL